MGGSPTYVYVDGKRLAPAVAAAFGAMDRAFQERFPGLELIVSDGVRTWQEQYNLWREYLRGGVLALHPDNSQAYHVETNPRGQRAVDLRDSGADAGVLTPGTERATWLYHNAPRFGFSPAGYGFSQIEPWHYEYQGNPWVVTAGLSPEPDTGVDETLQRRRKEHSMYIQGASDPTVYNVWTDANGQMRLRFCLPGEAAYARAGGLVVGGDDATLMMVASDAGYEYVENTGQVIIPTVRAQ